MKKLLLLLSISLFVVTSMFADRIQERRILTSTEILKDVFKTPKTGITKDLIKNAKAIAVFPNTLRSAFFLGGRYGDGILSIKDENNSWSEPIFIHMKGLSFGMQFGVQSSDIVMIFKSNRSLDNLIKGKTTLGFDADVVVFAKGAKIESNTDEKLSADIRAFGKSSGLFVGVSVSGTSIYISDNDNFDYYGKLVYIDDILSHDIIKEKASAKKFKDVLYSF